MNKLDKNYLDLVKKILDEGNEKETRNGGTKSIFGYQFRHKMEEGFPLLTTKKLSFNNIRTELEWFLNGDTNIKYLVDNGCHIWNGDSYKNYLNKQNKSKSGGCDNCIDCYCGHTDVCDCTPMSKEEFINKIKTDDKFAKKWGELGPIYGSQWRKWRSHQMDINKNNDGSGIIKYKNIDQIQNLINEIKENPNSRRLMVNAWNVDDLNKMVLPPCHYGFQVYIRDLSDSERYKIWFTNNYETGMEYNENELPDFMNPYYKYTPSKAISLMWNQRSVDVGLGLGYNIASYGLLLCLLAYKTNMIPDELIGNLGDTHIYLDHIEGLKKQLDRKGKKLPNIKIEGDIKDPLENLKVILEEYDPHPHIFLPLSN